MISAVPADPKSTRWASRMPAKVVAPMLAQIASAVASALGRSAPVDTIPLTPLCLGDLLALSSDPP